MNPLSQLKDIHHPPAISWWPPALGWWLLLAIVLLVIVLAFTFRWFKKRKSKTIKLSKKIALTELSSIEEENKTDRNPQATIDQLSKLLKRLAIAKFPEQPIAAMHGSEWLKFLDEGIEDKAFSEGAGKVLTEGRFQVTLAEIKLKNSSELFTLIKRWIEKNV